MQLCRETTVRRIIAAVAVLALSLELVGSVQAASVMAVSPQAGATLNQGDPIDIDFYLAVDAAVEVTISGVQLTMDLGPQFQNGSFTQVPNTILGPGLTLVRYPWEFASTIVSDPFNPTQGVLAAHDAPGAADLTDVFQTLGSFGPKFLPLGATSGGIFIGGVSGTAGAAGGEVVVTLSDLNVFSAVSSFCLNGVSPGGCVLQSGTIPTGVIVAGGGSSPVCGNGVVETGEDCESPFGACCNNTTCTFLSGNVCRVGSADGFCDPAEVCPGNSASCPGNFVRPSSTVCRAGSGDFCDPTEFCTGVAGQSCPGNSIQPNGTICNAGSGDLCDPDEVCTGITGVRCPSGSTNLAPAGTVCNPGSGDLCDPAEVCSGNEDQACPSGSTNLAPAGTVCNPSAGLCDPAEQCSGVQDAACPADMVEPAGTVCAPAANPCELPAECDGVATDCPPNPIVPATNGCTVDGVANQPCQADDSGQVVVGTAGDDVMVGGMGDDTLRGRVGNDLLCGLEGADILIGEMGDDELFGGPGEDTLRGEEGEDFLSGGADDDLLVGGNANDILMGDGGDDLLRGQEGDDELSGGGDADILRGGNGSDTLMGDAGDDELFGEERDDFLTGGSGFDSLDGGRGSDTCDGESETKCEL